jgi:hypothetical protein
MAVSNSIRVGVTVRPSHPRLYADLTGLAEPSRQARSHRIQFLAELALEMLDGRVEKAAPESATSSPSAKLSPAEKVQISENAQMMMDTTLGFQQ